MSNIFDDHSAYNNFMVMNGLNRNELPPVSGYLLERKLVRTINEMITHEDKNDLANFCRVSSYHLDWAIEDIVHLDLEQLEQAHEILQEEGFRACMLFLTNNFISDQLEALNLNNQ